jgi:hypothetical protein
MLGRKTMKKEFIMAGLLSGLLALFGCGKAQKPEYEVADVYTGLRQQLFALDPMAIGLAPSPTNRVWAILMETGYPEAVVTLATIGDGTVSLYFSNGSGIIGVGQNEGPRRACLDLLAVAPDFLKYAQLTNDFPLPTNGQTRFIFLTFDGRLVAEALEDDLGNQRSPLSPLFYKAQDVITEARMAEEKTRAEQGGASDAASRRH